MEEKNLPQTPQEANMAEIHRKYWLVLLIIVFCVGIFSYQAPISMAKALHSTADEIHFTIGTADETGSAPLVNLSDELTETLLRQKCNHMVQKDADIGNGDIVIHPDEDSGYAIVFFSDGTGYVYATDAMKLRCAIVDKKGELYSAVSQYALRKAASKFTID